MSDNTATLEEFLAKATTTLHQTEHNLAALAKAALFEQEQLLAAPENGHSSNTSGAGLRLQKVGQQLLRLAEQSNVLQAYLQNGFEASLLGDAYWPQIRILRSHEEERAQLARELEDGVGQLLANAIFELASCRRLLAEGQESVADGLDALQAELEQGLADVRHFITNLEPATILHNFGLAGGIRRYLEQYQLKTGLKTQLLMKTNFGRLPSIIETTIFRVIQEALSNVHRHSNASQVDVMVEENDGTLQFNVIDNGAGFVLERIATDKRNLGLARMVDYAELLNGQLRILSEPGRGTQVILSIAYPKL